jgi:hypothetical protein
MGGGGVVVREVALELLLVPELAEATVVGGAVGDSGRRFLPVHGAAAAAAYAVGLVGGNSGLWSVLDDGRWWRTATGRGCFMLVLEGDEVNAPDSTRTGDLRLIPAAFYYLSLVKNLSKSMFNKYIRKPST